MLSMTRSRRGVALVLALLTLVFSSVSLGRPEPKPRIVVTGEGAASIAPDMAVVNMTVTREASTAQEALRENSEAMRKVMQAMSALGVAKRDLQTANFSIQPRYSRPARNNKGVSAAPQIVGYTVRNGLTVRVREMDDVGTVLDKAVTLGVNEGGNIAFTNADASSSITQARKKAVKQARQKADTLAEAAGVSVGEVLEISEQSYNPRPMAMGRAAMMMDSLEESVPIAGGENTYKVTVSLTYAIAR